MVLVKPVGCCCCCCCWWWLRLVMGEGRGLSSSPQQHEILRFVNESLWHCSPALCDCCCCFRRLTLPTLWHWHVVNDDRDWYLCHMIFLLLPPVVGAGIVAVPGWCWAGCVRCWWCGFFSCTFHSKIGRLQVDVRWLLLFLLMHCLRREVRCLRSRIYMMSWYHDDDGPIRTDGASFHRNALLLFSFFFCCCSFDNRTCYPTPLLLLLVYWNGGWG